MRYPKIIGFCFALLLLLSPPGCTPAGTTRPQVAAGIETDKTYELNNERAALRFQEAPPQNKSAVESAIELLDKHARLSEKAAELETKNHDLITENDQLKQQTAQLESELAQAKKELAEANNLLIETRVELNNWKTDILGFRDEMRQAEKAQLEGLLKILRILSGEVTVEFGPGSNVEETANTTIPISQDEPNQAATQETFTRGNKQ